VSPRLTDIAVLPDDVLMLAEPMAELLMAGARPVHAMEVMLMDPVIRCGLRIVPWPTTLFKALASPARGQGVPLRTTLQVA
jgi:hypothetical protein